MMAQEQLFLNTFIALNQIMSRLVEKTGSVPTLPSYTVAQASALTGVSTGSMIYVTNESGGAQPAFFDGTNFRRCTDRNVIS